MSGLPRHILLVRSLSTVPNTLCSICSAVQGRIFRLRHDAKTTFLQEDEGIKLECMRASVWGWHQMPKHELCHQSRDLWVEQSNKGSQTLWFCSTWSKMVHETIEKKRYYIVRLILNQFQVSMNTLIPQLSQTAVALYWRMLSGISHKTEYFSFEFVKTAG